MVIEKLSRRVNLLILSLVGLVGLLCIIHYYEVLIGRPVDLDFRKSLNFNSHLTEEERIAAESFSLLTETEVNSIVKKVKIVKSDDKNPKNIFFLKTSKTGSTTLMSIFQRYGLRYKMNFLLGENNGGMARNDRPINLDDDCWIGKNSKNVKNKFNISTNHLHYNKTAIEALMASNHFKLSILRNPETQFISSFKYYHDLFPDLTIRLNPSSRYNQMRKRTRDIRFKPDDQDIVYELHKFLSTPWKYVQKYKKTSFAWMALIRPQLLFFGASPSGIESFDRKRLNRPEVLLWLDQIIQDFDVIILLEYLELGLAIVSLQLNIPTDDLVYTAVNIQSQKSVDGSVLKPSAQVQLKRLNWPDFLLYQAANATFWSRVRHFGFEKLKKIGDEIGEKSEKIKNECLDQSDDFTPPNAKIRVPILKADQRANSTCRKMVFQGTPTTKLFQANQIAKILENEPNYRFCTQKIIYGMNPKDFKKDSGKKKTNLLNKFSVLNNN